MRKNLYSICLKRKFVIKINQKKIEIVDLQEHEEVKISPFPNYPFILS